MIDLPRKIKMPEQTFQKDAIPTFVPHEIECKATGCVKCMLRHFSCVQLCNPVDGNPPGSSVHEISQASIQEWVAFPPPGALPHPGTEHTSLMSPTTAGFLTSATWETLKELSRETQRSKAD